MEKLIYPCKTMRISQDYHGIYSHAINSTGKPCDYPWDEAGDDEGRDWFYAPAKVKIIKIAGINSSITNTIWLESVAPVEMPCGNSTVMIMVIHPEDEDLSVLNVGQTFDQGQPIFREGRDGKASGNHFHISVAKGSILDSGWLQNSKGAWVINATGINIKPEEAFFITKETIVLDSKGLKFKWLGENYMVENQAINIVKKVLNETSGTPSNWAEDDWVTATAKGIVDGKSPKAYPTREQVVSMILRAKEV